jgi:hypothetical protein
MIMLLINLKEFINKKNNCKKNLKKFKKHSLDYNLITIKINIRIKQKKLK